MGGVDAHLVGLQPVAVPHSLAREHVAGRRRPGSRSRAAAAARRRPARPTRRRCARRPGSSRCRTRVWKVLVGGSAGVSQAGAVGVEQPAVERAAQPAVLEAAVGQVGLAVGAPARETGRGGAVLVAEQHQLLAEQRHRHDRPVAVQLLGERRRLPVATQDLATGGAGPALDEQSVLAGVHPAETTDAGDPACRRSSRPAGTHRRRIGRRLLVSCRREEGPAMDDFTGRLAVVTGGGTGMGRGAGASSWPRRAARVATCDLTADTARRHRGPVPSRPRRPASGSPRTGATWPTRPRCSPSGTRWSPSTTPTTSTCCSTTPASAAAAASSTATASEWDRTFDICWGGVYNCCRAFVPLLVASDEGYIVNTSSVNGFWALARPRRPPHRVQHGQVRREGLHRGADGPTSASTPRTSGRTS